MPHCIIEHSDNIKDSPSWKKLFKDLHQVLVDTSEINESDKKSRVIVHNNYFIGDDSKDQAFVTLDIQLLDILL